MESSTVNAQSPEGRHRTVITAASGFELPSLKDLWDSRDLIYLLVRRDVMVRYKQTAVGGAWAILQPLLFAAVFSIFFGRYARIPSGADVPYPVFALSGMVLWLYMSSSLTKVGDSTLTNSQLITKVYFPRAIIPLASSVQPLLDFAVAFSIVIPVSLAYGVTPSFRILLLPILLTLAWAVVLGAGLWLSALNVKYRDVGFVVSFMVLIGLFMTPIVYPFDLVPGPFQPFYALNPAVGILETYRWLLFPDASWPGLLLVVPLVAAPLFCVSGAWYFQRAEHHFADII